MTAQLIGIEMARRGRKRKDGPRNEAGRLAYGHRGEEKPEQIRRVALIARRRHVGARETVIEEEGKRRVIGEVDPMWGYALGRLLIAGLDPYRMQDGITRDQHEAGVAFADLHVRFCHYKGFRLPTLKSPALLDAVRGLSTASEPSEDQLMAVFRRHGDAVRAVMDGAGLLGWRILCDVAVKDVMPDGPSQLGYLRMALNALARHGV